MYERERRRGGWHLVEAVPFPFVVFKKLIRGFAVIGCGCTAAAVVAIEVHVFCCFERGS